MKIVLYEKDFKLRKLAEGKLESAKLDFVSCFSMAKLKHTIEKGQRDGDQYAIFLRNDEADCSEIQANFSPCYFFKEATLDQDTNSLATNVRNRAAFKGQGDKYKLDLVCIGGSTGGIPVIQKIIKGIKPQNSIFIICQHISQNHNNELRDSLSKVIKGKVEFVEDSKELKKGHFYILSGGNDFELRARYNKFFLEPVGLTSENFHPSINHLTDSLTRLEGPNVGVIIVSGLGSDGSKHLTKLKQKNVKILVQDPSSAIAPYMPKSAISTGTVDHVYSCDQLHDFIKRSAA